MDHSKKIKSALEFLRYISKPLDSSIIEKHIKDNNIILERIDLYISFIRSLYIKVIDTYLGDDVINSEIRKEEHFNWCWNNVVKDYRNEGFDFSN